MMQTNGKTIKYKCHKRKQPKRSTPNRTVPQQHISHSGRSQHIVTLTHIVICNTYYMFCRLAYMKSAVHFVELFAISVLTNRPKSASINILSNRMLFAFTLTLSGCVHLCLNDEQCNFVDNKP